MPSLWYCSERPNLFSLANYYIVLNNGEGNLTWKLYVMLMYSELLCGMQYLSYISYFTIVVEEQQIDSQQKDSLEAFEWKEVRRRSRSNSLRREEKVCTFTSLR